MTNVIEQIGVQYHHAEPYIQVFMQPDIPQTTKFEPQYMPVRWTVRFDLSP